MSKIIYSIGDSVVWGAELENKQEERFSHYVANHFGAIDCNNATAGVSNDYIYRHAVRDIMGWLNDGSIWSEETGWVNGEELIVVIGWTAPTRFEWWDGKKYQQEDCGVDMINGVKRIGTEQRKMNSYYTKQNLFHLISEHSITSSESETFVIIII